jgi:hypothetical protein
MRIALTGQFARDRILTRGGVKRSATVGAAEFATRQARSPAQVWKYLTASTCLATRRHAAPGCQPALSARAPSARTPPTLLAQLPQFEG